MKILFYHYLYAALILCGMLLPVTDLNAGSAFHNFNTFSPTTTAPAFSRTFRPGTTSRNHDWCQDERRGTRSAVSAVPTKNLSLTITYADFQAHLAEGRDRIIQEISRPAGIPMDVGPEGIETGNWVLPTFSAYPPVAGGTIFSQVVLDTPYPDDYPDATHAFYSPGVMQYEYFELFEDDGSGNGVLFYFGGTDADFLYVANRVMSPVPLQLGLGVFGGDDEPIACGELEGFCDDIPGASYIISTHSYEEVASGVLTTFDDGTSEAFKVLHSEEVVVYDTDDNAIDVYYYDEIIFYSKAGHYVICELAEGAPWEGMTSFTKITYQKLSAEVLPVEWLGISAEALGKGNVAVRWSTQTEVDSDRFIVEHSSDGLAFSALGTVAAQGNSAAISHYSYTHEAATAGTNYYRIRQIDHGGAESLSALTTVLISPSLGGGEDTVVLYPNPGKDEVRFNRPAEYELFSSNGRLLESGRADGNVDVSQLLPGSYLIRIDGGNTYRWIKAK
jgi:hypothetical protein